MYIWIEVDLTDMLDFFVAECWLGFPWGMDQETMSLEEKCLWWHQLADGRKGGPLLPVQMLKWWVNKCKQSKIQIWVRLWSDFWYKCQSAVKMELQLEVDSTD